MSKGIVLVVSGPSGVGKGTVCKYLTDRENDIFLSVSATSRKPRVGEIDGEHYYFKTPEEFAQMVENDEFLEYANYVSSSYGTPKAPCFDHLEKGESVIVYPDIDYTAGYEKESEIYEGFLLLGQLYKRSTGKSLRFVPLYIDDAEKSIKEFGHITIDDFRKERTEAYDYIKAAINGKETVVK